MKVLVVQPSLRPPGGGEAVAAWIIQALEGAHDVSVLSWHPIDFDAVNRYYGTAIDARAVRWIDAAPRLRPLLRLLPTPIALVKMSVVSRRARALSAQFDAIVSGQNETDLGPRCLQYVHYPSHLRPRPAVDLRWYHVAPLLRLYYYVCDELIAGFVADRVGDATTVANSRWTADLITRVYGIAPVQVLHPPVAVTSPGLDWSAREDAFLCIGRISPEKEIERVVAILAAVRDRVPGVRLRIVGSRGGPSAYARHIEHLVSQHAAWISLHVDVPRPVLLDLIARSRYCIHGMREEHFGIAPAEALAGGCIVFVPDGGGQVEIVGDERRLRFGSDADAVEKIVAVMGDPVLQASLRSRLGARAGMFTADRFVSRVRELVEGLPRRAAVRAPAS